jgi:hypothetical protein
VEAPDVKVLGVLCVQVLTDTRCFPEDLTAPSNVGTPSRLAGIRGTIREFFMNSIES